MKPLNLSLSSFGPFASRVTVDFEAATSQGLFLIQGPTGSGKTSLLDGLCYALFGLGSGDKKDKIEFRSHHAEENEPLSAEFVFSLGGRIYRASRSYSVKNGGVHNEQALVEVKEGDSWVALASRPQKTNEKIVELLRLDADQFRQVIVLPQGKFRDFLIADAQTRMDILQSLFQTEKLEYFEDFLREKSAKLQGEVQVLLERRNTLVKGQGLELETDLGQALDDARALEKQSLGELEFKKAILSAARNDHERAKQNLALHREAEEMKALLEDLDTQKERYAELELALTAHRNLLPLLPLYQDLQRYREEARENEAQVKAAAEKRADLEAKLEEKNKVKEKLDEELDRLADYEALHLLLRDLVPKKLQAERLDEKRGLAQNEKKAYGAELAEKSKRRESERESLKKLRQDLEALAQRAEKIPALEALVKECEGLFDLNERLDQGRSGLRDLEYGLSDASQRFLHADQELRQSRMTFEDWDAALKHGEVIRLAGALRDGEACPVCGSLHHPAPAETSAWLPDRERFEALAASVARNEAEKNELFTRKALLEQETSRKREEIDALAARGKDAEEAFREGLLKLVDPEKLKSSEEEQAKSGGESGLVRLLFRVKEGGLGNGEWKKLEEKLRESLAGLAELKARLPGLRDKEAEKSKALESLEKETTRLETLVQAKSEEEARIAGEGELLGKEIGELRERIGGNLGGSLPSSAALSREAEKLLQKIEGLKKEKESFYRDYQTLKDALLGAARDSDQLAKRRVSTAEKEKAAQELWHEAIGKAGFPDEGSALSGRLEAAEAAKTEADLRAYHTDLAVARSKAADFEAKLSGIERPDPEPLRLALETAEEAYEAAGREHQARLRKIGDLEKLSSELGDLEQALSAKEAAFQSTASLHRLINGTSSPNRVSLQRYALSVYLEEVLNEANRQLRVMSRGRYCLQLQGKSTDKRRAGGLDLCVLDDYTGQTRSTQSLSGGESFIAALSLALGLSSVVYQRSGGHRLDTLFIDEGFGSLDEEALQDAMQTLGKLKENGRLVGIISHVKELQERIPVQLRLVKSPRGSTVEWKT